jgi:anthranilate/para-aminobenzoate synthase component II
MWQSSDDGYTWTDIEGIEIRDNDTYRNIIDFKPVNTRYYRLVIYSQNALQAQINSIIPYVRGAPEVPDVPDGDYVLIIGNQMNGFTYTQIARFVENRGYETVTIPHQDISLKILRALRKRPMAIIFSGNNADWQYLPLFEFFGEFEIIRKVYDIPMMGICAGHEFYAMAYGISFAHWMGWFDDTMLSLAKGQTPEKVRILPQYVDDPIYEGVPNPFRAIEIHSWAISPLFLQDERYKEFHVTAETSYIQALKSSKRPAYSAQFHGAVVNKYNQSGIYLANFLKVAKKYKGQK